MMMELTFDAASGATRRSPVTTWVNARHPHTVRVPATPQPPDETPEIGRGSRTAREWRASNRGLQRVEAVFAAVAFVGLLALGTLTFGYAFDGLTATHAAGTSSVSASR